MTEDRIITAEGFAQVLTLADAERARVIAEARLAFAEAMAEAERAWYRSAGASLGWEAKP